MADNPHQPKLYRPKSSKEIAAMHWTGGRECAMDIMAWAQSYGCHIALDIKTAELCVRTKEGEMRGPLGCFIIKGIQNEFYPCDQVIFFNSYEEKEIP